MEFYDPVKPDKMAMLFAYTCPHCMNEVVLVSPTQPQSVTCGACRASFPIGESEGGLGWSRKNN